MWRGWPYGDGGVCVGVCRWVGRGCERCLGCVRGFVCPLPAGCRCVRRGGCAVSVVGGEVGCAVRGQGCGGGRRVPGWLAQERAVERGVGWAWSGPLSVGEVPFSLPCVVWRCGLDRGGVWVGVSRWRVAVEGGACARRGGCWLGCLWCVGNGASASRGMVQRHLSPCPLLVERGGCRTSLPG